MDRWRIFYSFVSPRGLTTAAGVWATAAIGMACGARLYILASAGCGLLIILQVVFHTPLKIFRPKRFYSLKITFIETDDEREKVKSLFCVEHYNHLIVERITDKLLYKATIFTDKEFDSITLDKIMKNNTYIISIERGDEE